MSHVAENGPWIGIVTTRLPDVVLKSRAVKRPAVHFCRIAQEANRLGARVVLFTPKDVRWSSRQVLGWVPVSPTDPFGNWTQRVVVLPNVIYENVYVHLSVNGYTEDLRKRAKKLSIPLFNPIMPGKWQMVGLLNKSVNKDYLPPTERLSDVLHAIRLIDEWKVAYVKPSGGYGGNGVTRIESLPNGNYRMSVDRINGRVKGIREIITKAELIRRLAKRREPLHLVQKGIDLMTVAGRRLDFRVVVHRDGEGKWQLIGIVPKQAAKDGVVTNLIAGGESLSLERAVLMARREGKQLPVRELEQCAKRIALLLSERNSHVGLAGFDLGVDQSGKVWLIEMNPKPARSLMTVEMRQTLAKTQAQFAIWLAHQNKSLPEPLKRHSGVTRSYRLLQKRLPQSAGLVEML